MSPLDSLWLHQLSGNTGGYVSLKFHCEEESNQMSAVHIHVVIRLTPSVHTIGQNLQGQLKPVGRVKLAN
jgi:hypothetical protein